MTRPPAEQHAEAVQDPWEASRAEQRRFWAAQPVERRVTWLEEALAAAYQAGALPRRPELDRDRAPVVPLVGSPAQCAEAETARSAILERVQVYCRGPVPGDFEPMAFALFGAELQFALWREAEARFWIEIRDDSIEKIATRVGLWRGEQTGLPDCRAEPYGSRFRGPRFSSRER